MSTLINLLDKLSLNFSKFLMIFIKQNDDKHNLELY